MAKYCPIMRLSWAPNAVIDDAAHGHRHGEHGERGDDEGGERSLRAGPDAVTM